MEKHLYAKILAQTTKPPNFVFILTDDHRYDMLGCTGNPIVQTHKGMLFEGGIRVPFLVSWPKGLKGGLRYHEVVSALDIYPTILAATGIEHPDKERLDGVDLIPFLNGKNQNSPHDMLFWRYSDGAGYAVRKGKHKMVMPAFKNDFFLFDLEKDPYEHHNLAGDFPEILEGLKADYVNWSKGTIPAKWYDPHIESVKKEEAKRQKFIDKASMGEKN